MVEVSRKGSIKNTLTTTLNEEGLALDKQIAAKYKECHLAEVQILVAGWGGSLQIWFLELNKNMHLKIPKRNFGAILEETQTDF